MRPDLSDISPLVDRLRWDQQGHPYSARDYLCTADELADRCGQLLAAGQAAAVVPVLRRAVDWVTSALRDIDDSPAATGNELYRLMTLYAQACQAAGRPAEAIEWARRGLADGWDGRHVDRLRDVLVDLLVEYGDPAGAVRERQDGFTRRPTAANWRALRETAGRVGADAEPDWAIKLLSERAAGQPAYVPELVEVLLAERRADEAWQVGLAHLDQLPPRRRAELLELRQATAPKEVQEPYRRLIEEQLLDSRDKRRYQRAVALLRQLRQAHLAAGDLADFDGYVAELRHRHKRRRTFLAHLDGAGL